LQKKLATASEHSHNHSSYDDLAELDRQPTGDPLLDFAVNHMSLANASYESLLVCASRLGCVGVELRTDLAAELFDGKSAQSASFAAQQHGLRILALSEVCAFNDFTDAKREEAAAVIQIAADCGAEAISLIPRNDGIGCAEGERQNNLLKALQGLQPLLEAHNLVGLIEPLGFTHCSLRNKGDVVEAIDALGVGHCFKLVHDTFHHYLAGGPVFPEHTAIVHVSGVTDASVSNHDMRDSHRVLVDAKDRLGNIAQLDALGTGGYQGPVSFEAFSPTVHQLADPVTALRESISFIKSSRAAVAA